MLNGRQLAWLIFVHFKLPEVTVRMFRLQDLMTLQLTDDNLAQYNLEWDEMLASMPSIPAEDVLDALYTTQVQKSTEFRGIWELYNYDIVYKQTKPSYQNLKKLVNTFLEKKTKDKLRKAMGSEEASRNRTRIQSNAGGDLQRTLQELDEARHLCRRRLLQMDS